MNPSNKAALAQGQKFSQKLVTREPVYDRTLKVHRPRKKKNSANPKYF